MFAVYVKHLTVKIEKELPGENSENTENRKNAEKEEKIVDSTFINGYNDKACVWMCFFCTSDMPHKRMKNYYIVYQEEVKQNANI